MSVPLIIESDGNPSIHWKNVIVVDFFFDGLTPIENVPQHILVLLFSSFNLNTWSNDNQQNLIIKIETFMLIY